MNSPTEQDSNSFQALVSAWEDAYVCAVYAYVAVKTPNEPRLLYGRIVLEPTRSGVSETPLKYETEHIVAARFVNAVRGNPGQRLIHVDASGRAHIDPVNAEYRIVFAPLGGQIGSRHASRQGLDSLTDFLQQAGVPISEIERTWQALAKRRVHSIPRIALTPAQLEALGL